ncbi:hypothetical protein [Chitinophaga vietnamensis]|uniref:hypothetical protein n=1 Tax=Chitinophaga vietnamensis TaxID=2593957 RepID=UPI00117780BC|nr:hypothetical protein [Chitinophaga vietnamensis]
MKYRCLLLLLLVIPFCSVAQQLSLPAVKQLAQSLTDQQLLTPFGRDELIRFAQQQPLLAYKDVHDLDELRQPIYVAESAFIHLLPGDTRITRALLDSVSRQVRFDDDALQEEYFLADRFPVKRDLYNFVRYIGDYYASANPLLIKRFGEYFGKAAFDSSGQFRPGAIPQAFIQAGILPADDPFKERDNASELGKRLDWLDKYPYAQQRQMALLDSLRATGLFTDSARQLMTTRYQPFTLLTVNDIFGNCGYAVPLYYATDIEPYAGLPENAYGVIDTNALHSVMQRVTSRIHQHIVPMEITAWSAHKVPPSSDGQYPYEEELALRRSAKLQFAELTIGGHLYKEVIDEKEFETWIRPENFQFLNHVMEDRKDPRRFFFIEQERYTGLEPAPIVLFVALLTERQAALLQSKYLFKRIEGCYNGSPGDYQNCVYPGDYFYPERRLSAAQIHALVTWCAERQLLNTANKALLPHLEAAIREENPQDMTGVLRFSPAFINTEPRLSSMISSVQWALSNAYPQNKKRFIFNSKSYPQADIDMNKLQAAINKALVAAGFNCQLVRLIDSNPLYRQDDSGAFQYMLLKPAVAKELKEQHPEVLYAPNNPSAYR